MLVADAVERARRHAPDKVFFTELEPSLVEGVPGRLDRAVYEPARQRRQVEPAPAARSRSASATAR